MNILEQLNLARKKAMYMEKITTIGDLAIGEEFKFTNTKEMIVGDMFYVCNPRTFPYGAAIVTGDLGYGEYRAKRTS